MTFNQFTREELEKFQNISISEIDEVKISYKMYNALTQAGCGTLADVAVSTVEELSAARNMTPRRLKKLFDQIEAKWNITVPTAEQKRQIHEDSIDIEILAIENKILEQKAERVKSILKFYRERANDEEEKRARRIEKERKIAQSEAKRLMEDAKSPVARLIGCMYFGKSAVEGGGFCSILRLWNKGCLLEDDASENNSLNHSCEECIDNFLADYYWSGHHMDLSALEEGKVAKVLRVKDTGMNVVGVCSRCRKKIYAHQYDDEMEIEEVVHFCSRCGYPLDWG